MKPGKELNEWIAEHVFGWKKVSEDVWDQHKIGEGTFRGPLPDYSTDMNAAMDVVEKAGITAIIKVFDGRWMARLNDPADLDTYYEVSCYKDCEDFAIGETAPHAICLAAMKALEIK